MSTNKNIDSLPVSNIANLLIRTETKFQDNIAFQYRTGKHFLGISWKQLVINIRKIAVNLRKYDFKNGDKMVIFSPNRLEMLELELAVMASGGIAVPIFAYFKNEMVSKLIRHSDAKFLAVSGNEQLENVSSDLDIKRIFVFDKIENNYFSSLIPFGDLLTQTKGDELKTNALPNEICLNMFTSGTMGVPKCVQLTHQNILSQQSAMAQIWNIGSTDRFLSYLPWHHSFGGIYELFSALYNGATLSLDSSGGKNMETFIENWKMVMPTVFFSVPKISVSLMEFAKQNKEAEQIIFHKEMKFIFSAAAPLPSAISDEFEKRNIPIMEGWGLTETSPCCTVTSLHTKRKPGIVGKPIPGVSIRIGDENEIQVKGPNVMVGYYNNPQANQDAFTDDSWYRTGDIGEITEDGLKLIARKDRIFKLSNGEKVVSTEMESLLLSKCHYLSFGIVEGSGKDYPVALIFPNKKFLNQPNYEISPMDGCFCPKNLEELSHCLRGCLNDANCGIKQKFSRVRKVALIDDELTIENGTLTPSMKVAPGNVVRIYKALIEDLYVSDNPIKENVYVIELKHDVYYERTNH